MKWAIVGDSHQVRNKKYSKYLLWRTLPKTETTNRFITNDTPSRKQKYINRFITNDTPSSKQK